MILKSLLLSLVVFLPVSTHAANTLNIETFFTQLGGIIALLIPIAFALILLFFFWGLAKYMFGDAEDKEKGKNLMIYGVIALFVAASIWGLVAFLGEVFGIEVGTDDADNPYVDANRDFSL